MKAPFPLFCFLYKNASIYQQPLSHYKLSESFVNDAVDFVRGAKEQKKPFFLYYGTAQAHVDLYSNKDFRGSSKRGRYGDNIREMAWTIGKIMDEVKRIGEEFNTLSIFTSDNGPLISLCNEGGDAGILKGGKTQFWEGGVRVPGIFHWPGHIRPASTSDVVTSQMDIFPTLMEIVGGSVPDDRIMDGQDISSTLFNWWPEPQPESVVKMQLYKKPTAEATYSEPRVLVFYCNEILYTVRFGSYKFHFNTHKTWTKEEHHAIPGRCGDGGFPLNQNIQCTGCSANQRNPPECFKKHDPPLMYNLDKDPQEAYPLNVSLPANKPIFEEMMNELEKFLDKMVMAPSLFADLSPSVIPCCTPESFPNCTCNYKYEGPDPPPGSANIDTQDSQMMLNMVMTPQPP
ncbi:arylsulfatase-like [Amphiura filiformis]|uniref:arylsulfatase-like n=1 Tax=Amphiura filiformis TaxID=82378 RepID=UPI003B21FD60